jgi:hypothetical protein
VDKSTKRWRLNCDLTWNPCAGLHFQFSFWRALDCSGWCASYKGPTVEHREGKDTTIFAFLYLFCCLKTKMDLGRNFACYLSSMWDMAHAWYHTVIYKRTLDKETLMFNCQVWWCIQGSGLVAWSSQLSYLGEKINIDFAFSRQCVGRTQVHVL